MCRWNFAFALSFVMMASEASAGFESWQVSSNCGGAAFVSNWDLNIEDYTGEVHGSSTWTCCSGVNNRITGRIGELVQMDQWFQLGTFGTGRPD
jgi:hypothetical protein